MFATALPTEVRRGFASPVQLFKQWATPMVRAKPQRLGPKAERGAEPLLEQSVDGEA